MTSLPVRCALFVPASRPERFAKALQTDADIVIIDLEDAVEHALKDQARRNVREFLSAHPQARVWVRVNDATTRWFNEDLALCAELPGVVAIVLPKAESAVQVRQAGNTGKPVVPIVESARGVVALSELASAPGVMRLSFGSLDLMLEMGTRPDTAGAATVLDHIRCQILLYSAMHGLQAPLDGVYPDFANLEGLAAVAARSRDMGFAGLLAIHPKQVAIIQATFVPSPQEREWATRVVEQADATGSLAFQVDGKMVDAPVIARARQVLAACR